MVQRHAQDIDLKAQNQKQDISIDFEISYNIGHDIQSSHKVLVEIWVYYKNFTNSSFFKNIDYKK